MLVTFGRQLSALQVWPVVTYELELELRILNINCISSAIGYLFDYLCEWKLVCNTIIAMLQYV